MDRYLVIIEEAKSNFSAYSPDLPGCVATGEIRNECEQNMHEAIQLYINGLEEDKEPVPVNHSFAEYMAVWFIVKIFLAILK